MHYDDVVADAVFTVEAEVKVQGFLIARIHYAQIKGGYVCEAGGWGDRNNLQVVQHSLFNIYKAIADSALHRYTDKNGFDRVNWQTHMRKRYGKDHVAPAQSMMGVPLE